MTILLDALSALGLLVKNGNKYQTEMSAVPLLAGSSPDSVLPVALHMCTLWRTWSSLTDVVLGTPPAQMKEQGCISYELFQDINNQNIFSFIEAWENQDALDMHMKSAHFQKIVPEMALLREKPAEINVYRLVLQEGNGGRPDPGRQANRSR
jgi:quinol monooxygenase YgiN